MSDRMFFCDDHVDQPYARVRAAILADPEAVLQRATSRAGTDAVRLPVNVGGLEIATDVAIRVTDIDHDHEYGAASTTLTLAWHAVSHPQLRSSLQAKLAIFALSPTETQLELRGIYHPQLGSVLDATAGHPLAEASVRGLVREVATWLREHRADPQSSSCAPQASTA
jgi:hypothetical protein